VASKSVTRRWPAVSVRGDLQAVYVAKVAVVRRDRFVQYQPVCGDDGIDAVQVAETVGRGVFAAKCPRSPGDAIVDSVNG